MGFYARPSWRLARQVGSDAFMLAWGVAWFLIGRLVDGVIAALAEPQRQLAGTVTKMRDQLLKAADDTGKLPGVGGELRKPLDQSAGGLADVARQAMDQVHAIEATATVVGWLTFFIPVAMLLAVWLPKRLRFYAQSRAAQGFVDGPADLDLFALRAMATQPMEKLARISPDPVAAWRSGDREVIDALAALELRSAGLTYRPRSRAGKGSTAAVTSSKRVED